MKRLATAFALAVTLFSAYGATRVWTGASGKWSDAANWLDGATPSADDTVYVSNTVSGITIGIDVPGVSIASIRFEGAGPVALEGETLTLTGGWTFNLHTPGVYNNKMNYHTSTFSWLAFTADVDCRVPLVFAPSGNTCGICAATNIVHFRKDITIQGAKTFYFHNGFQPNPDAVAAGVPSGSRTVPVYFHGEVVGTEATLRPTQSPTGPMHFEKAVKVKAFKISGYTSAVAYLYSADNEWENAETDYGNIVMPKTCGALPANLVFSLAGTYSSSRGILNLGNFDATIDRLDDTVGGLEKYAGTAAGGRILSSSHDEGTYGYSHPVTLTMKATANGTTTLMVQTDVSLVWDPQGDYTLTFTNRTSDTKGSLRVKGGKVRLTGNAAFPNVENVTVDANAKFEVASSAAKPVSQTAYLHLGANAKLAVPQGVSYTVGMVSVAGALVADGTYSGTGPNAVGWIEGDGAVTVSGTALCAWEGAVSGSWSDATKWHDGRIPDGTERGVYIFNDSAADFTVSIDAPVSAFPTNLLVRNLGGGRTTLSCAVDVSATRASLLVGEGGRIKVESGAQFYHTTMDPTAFNALASNIRAYSPACSVTIAPGSTVFTNFYGTFTVKGAPQLPGRFDMRCGNFLFCDLGSVWPISIHTNGVVDLRDGTFNLPHHGYNHNTDVSMKGGTLVLSNTTFSAEGTFSTANGGSVTFGTGETVFMGTSSFLLRNGNRFLRPNEPGQTARLVMKGIAEFADRNNNLPWFTGGVPGGRAVFDYEAGDSVKSRPFLVGDAAGEAELNVKSGILRIHNVGLKVAGLGGQNKPSETGVVARVSVAAGAAMHVEGTLDSGWGASATLCGLTVGAGNSADTPGFPFDGHMEVAGAVTNRAGPTVIGWGTGKGTYVQNGGETYLKQDTSWNLRPITALGLGGGIGRLIVSNGTFKVANGTMFVGGCPESEVTCFDNKSHERVVWTPTGVPANNHDADGTLTVAGGAFSVKDELIVGADGSGTLEMVGTEGSCAAGRLVLSNATSSVARFVAGPGGFSPIAVTGELAVTDGASVQVDLSGNAGSVHVFRLFNFASSSGDLESMPVTLFDANGVSRKPCRLVKNANSLDLAIITGTAIIFR